MSFDIDEKNSSNSMIVKDILNEFPFDKSEIKDDEKEINGIPISRVIDLDKYENLLQILKCKICLNILLNPYDCSKCGNTFCYSCINKLKESNKKCPFGCTDYEIMPSSFAIKKFLNQLQFQCLNKENGCNEIISYNNIEQHDKNCEYINSICPNNQCGIKVPWNLLKNHIENECLYTLYECDKCHLKLNRKEIESHDKLCNVINKQFDKDNIIINKMTKDDIDKKRKEFLDVMNSIENLNFFNEEKDKENKDKNSDMNILVKSLIFIFSRKMSFIEDKINKINSTLQQFSENNLIFYQSINDELENINEKITNLNNNENNSNKINESDKVCSINAYNINKNKIEKKKGFKIKKLKTRKLKEHRNTLNYIDNSLESTIINNKKKLSTEIITLNNNIYKKDNKDTSFNLKDKLKKMENNNEESDNDLNNLLDEYLKRKKQKIKISNFFNQNKE